MSTKLIGIKEEVQQYHRRKLEQLALYHIGDIAQTEVPSWEDKQWILGRLKQPKRYWEAYT